IDNGIKPIPISVNMSRADIYNPNIDQILMNIVNKYNVLPQFLYLEITETAYIENEQDLIITLKKLKKLGFIIAMDDFGSGYSSLNMLSELPIDVLKLDIRFIQGNHFTKNRRDIISFIISLARWLNMHIIAEGIETIEQVNLLRSLGCERGQGYYFSKPLSIPDFTEFISSSLNNKNLVKQTTNKKNTLVYNKHDSILILDETNLEFNTLKQVFKKLYTTLSFTTADEM
ncbi:MAG: EAL domain-containing protein, partial [Erysipelotrichaceae bacterium]